MCRKSCAEREKPTEMSQMPQGRAMSKKTVKERNIAKYRPKIVECLKRGHSIKGTSGIVGIDRRTLYRWLREAEEDDATAEHIAFYSDYHSARGAGLEKLIKDLDRWENEVEMTTVDRLDFVRDEAGKLVVDEDGNPVGMLKERKTTTKRKRYRATHFERAKFKLISQYPDEWGPRSVQEVEPADVEDEEVTAVDLMEADDD